MAVVQKLLFTARWLQCGEEVSDWIPVCWCSQWPPSSLTEESTFLFTRISLGSFRKSLLTPGINKSMKDIFWAKLNCHCPLWKTTESSQGQYSLGDPIWGAPDDVGMCRLKYSLHYNVWYIVIACHREQQIRTNIYLVFSTHQALCEVLCILSHWIIIITSWDKYHFRFIFTCEILIIIVSTGQC